MSIQIVDNFKLNLDVPIDTRMVTKGQSSRNSIKYAYEGLRVYDIVEKASYVWLDGTWQKESSVTSVSASSGSAGGGSSTPPPTIATTNRIVKYTTSTTIGESSIFDKGTFFNPSVGIGKISANGIALDVVGMVKTTSFIGTISGNNLEIKSIDNTKIKPHNLNSGEFSLKTIGSQVVWNSTPSLNLNIVITNETSNTNTHYLLFSNTANNTTAGVPIYAHNSGTSRLIGIKPSTSQILASVDIINNKSTPSYTFSGTTNDTSGLYGNTTEVGLSFKSNALLKLNATKLSIFDISGIEVLKTGTNKVISTNGEFTTLAVTGNATLGSLKVNTGTNTFYSISPVDLNILTGGTATILNLIVGSTTTFTSLNITTLTVGPLTGAKLITNGFDCSADYDAPANFNSLTLTTLNVLDPDGFNFTAPGNYGYSARVTNLNVNGNTNFNVNLNISSPGGLIVLGAPTTNLALKINGGLNEHKILGAVYSTGFSRFKSVNLIGTGASGVLYCSKIRFEKTSDDIRDLITDADFTPPNSDGTNGGWGPWPFNDGISHGFVAGDIIFCTYLQPAQTNVWSATLNKAVNLNSKRVGRHFFYCGPLQNNGVDGGWRTIANFFSIGGGDPFHIINPNPDPFVGLADANAEEAYVDYNVGSIAGGNAGTGNGNTGNGNTNTNQGAGGSAGG